MKKSAKHRRISIAIFMVFFVSMAFLAAGGTSPVGLFIAAMMIGFNLCAALVEILPAWKNTNDDESQE